MFDDFLATVKSSAALLGFFSVFAAGLAFTVFSLFAGGDHGGDFHGDAGHGGAGPDADHGPGILSFRGLALMATGFGAVSFLVMYYTRNILVASVSGVGFGWVFALLGIMLMRLLVRQQGSSMIEPGEIIGAVGEVTTGIPSKGLGEVRLTVAGVALSKTARSTDGSAIRSGTTVRVVRSVGGSVAVEPLSAQQPAG